MLQHFIYRMCVWEWQNGSGGEIELIFATLMLNTLSVIFHVISPLKSKKLNFCMHFQSIDFWVWTWRCLIWCCALFVLDIFYHTDEHLISGCLIFDFQWVDRSQSRIRRHQWLLKIYKELLVCFKIHFKGKSYNIFMYQWILMLSEC